MHRVEVLELMQPCLPCSLQWVPHEADGIQLVDNVGGQRALTAQRALTRSPAHERWVWRVLYCGLREAVVGLRKRA